MRLPATFGVSWPGTPWRSALTVSRLALPLAICPERRLSRRVLEGILHTTGHFANPQVLSPRSEIVLLQYFAERPTPALPRREAPPTNKPVRSFLHTLTPGKKYGENTGKLAKVNTLVQERSLQPGDTQDAIFSAHRILAKHS